MYRKFQLSIYYSKRDIAVEKKPVENVFFCILGLVTCISLYLFLMIFISMYVIIN